MQVDRKVRCGHAQASRARLTARVNPTIFVFAKWGWCLQPLVCG